ncbi:glycerol-3-phosphate dehydrogenase [NAD(+)], cytoplasmic-like isoform X2 [Halichondria panicea]
MAQAGKKAALIGSGNWGSAIARIVGATTRDLPDFQSEVKMWVFPEKVNGRDLGDIINTEHENVKYLPGFKIPENVVACPDVIETIKGADILIFVVPHQFIARICEQIKDHIKPGVFGISLIKGMDVKDGNIRLISEVISNALSIDMSVLMGANVAKDVAQEDFCESTIGCRSTEQGDLLKKLFHSPTFQIRIIPDLITVELCGALKNIVAVAAGFCDGLQYGTSTKAAVLRIGLGEMWQFIKIFGGQDSISLLESCGVADLIATCFGGRNRRVSEAFVTSGKSFEVLEAEMLDGQKLQGPLTAKEVHEYLTKEGKTDQFPLFNVVHSICYEGLPPSDLLKSIAKL